MFNLYHSPSQSLSKKMKIRISTLFLVIVIYPHFSGSSRNQESDWFPPTPENYFFTENEVTSLLNELDSSEYVHGGDFGHHSPMSPTFPAHTNQDHEFVPRPLEQNATDPGGASSSRERRRPGRPKGSLTTRKPGQVLGRPRKKPSDQNQLGVTDPNDELNATGQGEGSSSKERRGPGRPRGSVTTRRPGIVLGRPRGSATTRRPGVVLGRPRGTRTNQNQSGVANSNDEVNAREPEKGSSLGEARKPGRPRGSVTTRTPGQALGRPKGTQVNQDEFRIADPNDGPPHRIVYYERTEIKVWLEGPFVRKSIFPSNYIPQGQYYTHHNFLVRTLERGDVKLVAYISRLETLIGVRPPGLPGQRYNLEPSPSVWYINYATTYLKVDVKNSVPTGMSIMPKNVHVPAESSVALETVAGITFRLFRDYPDFKITGVELVSYARIAP